MVAVERRYSDQAPNGERKEVFTTSILSPLEHKIIGSTPLANGVTLNVSELMQEARENPDAMNQLLTPIDLLEGNLSVRSVQLRRRNAAKTGAFTGALAVLNIHQVDLWLSGMGIQLSPSQLKKGATTITPEWELRLVDDKKRPLGFSGHTEAYGMMQLSEQFIEDFELADDPVGDCKKLRFVTH